MLRETYAELVKSYGANDPGTQDTGFYLASALLDVGNTEEAASITRTLIAEKLSAADARNDWGDRVAGLKGRILLAQGRRAEALALLEDAVSHLAKSHRPDWIVAPLRKALDRANGTA